MPFGNHCSGCEAILVGSAVGDGVVTEILF